VLAYVLFTLAPKTRHDRADEVRAGGLGDFDEELKLLLLAILAQYETKGEGELATAKLTSFLVGRYGSVSESAARLGEISAIRAAFRQMQSDLYAH
jgi:type I restriction enzyme, R subunit